jgi:hypothetical protein
MLSKCANPRCPASFLYLHEGKLFLLDAGLDADTDDPAVAAPQKSARRLEFFWLCTDCAQKLTLRYQKGVGITAVALSETSSAGMQRRAASATS